jgi:hypothetical protein
LALSRKRGYNDIDLMAEQSALQTLVLVAIAKKVGVGCDPALIGWLLNAEENATETLRRLEQQSRERR